MPASRLIRLRSRHHSRAIALNPLLRYLPTPTSSTSHQSSVSFTSTHTAVTTPLSPAPAAPAVTASAGPAPGPIRKTCARCRRIASTVSVATSTNFNTTAQNSFLPSHPPRPVRCLTYVSHVHLENCTPRIPKPLSHTMSHAHLDICTPPIPKLRSFHPLEVPAHRPSGPIPAPEPAPSQLNRHQP